MERSILKDRSDLERLKILATEDVGTINRDYPSEIGSLIASRGSGAYLYTHDGIKFLDYLMAWASLLIGHAHPAVIKAVTREVEKGVNFSLVHESMLEVAKTVRDMVPCAERVQFVASGSEATMLALRLARAYTGKEKVLKFDGAYHGWHDYLFINTNYRGGRFYDASRPKSKTVQVRPDSNGIPKAVQELVMIAPYNDTETTMRLIKKSKNELGAVIVEPLMRGIQSTPGFLQGIREITESLGIPLILDEVITGFRLAPGGAQEYYRITPDLATYSKALGGGLPLGAVAGKEEIMSLLHPKTEDSKRTFILGYGHSNTLSFAASLATLREMRKPGMYERLNGYGDRLRKGLADLFEKYDLDYQMTGAGSVVEYYFMKEQITDYNSAMKSNMKLKRDLWQEVTKKGMFCLPGRYFNSTAHGAAEFEQTLSTVDSALKELKRNKKV